MEQRKVIVSKMKQYPYPDQPGRSFWKLEEIGEATFHQFGTDYEEYETGPGNYTTAIVEWPDGRVESVRPEWVRFVTPNEGS